MYVYLSLSLYVYVYIYIHIYIYIYTSITYMYELLGVEPRLQPVLVRHEKRGAPRLAPRHDADLRDLM